MKRLEDWRAQLGEVEDGERKIQELIHKELEVVTANRANTTCSSSDGDDSGTLYLGFQKSNGARTWCCASDHAEEARLRRNGWNPKFHSHNRREVLDWVQQEVLVSDQGQDRDKIPANIHGNNEAEASVAPSVAESRVSVDPPASEENNAPNTLGDAAASSTFATTGAQTNTHHDRWNATQALRTSLGLPPLGTPDQQTRPASSSSVHQTSTTRPVNRYRPNHPSKTSSFRPPVSSQWDTARDAYERKRKTYWSNKLGIPLFLLKVDDNGRTYLWQDGKKFYLATRSNVPGPEQADDSYPVVLTSSDRTMVLSMTRTASPIQQMNRMGILTI